MKIKETFLENGATVIGVPIEGAKTVTIAFGLKVGSRLESAEIDGASHFIEHMLFKGSVKRPTYEEISKTADGLGAFLNGGTSKEYTYYYIQTIKENFTEALDIVADFVTRPILREEDFEMERGTIIEELKRVKDNPEADILRIMEANLFSGSSMEREVIGTEKSLSEMRYKDIKDYYKNYYCSSNLTVLVAGDIPESYLELSRKYTELLPIGSTSGWEPAFYGENRVRAVKRDINQTQLAITIPAFEISDKRRYALEIISTILGGSSSSRLFNEVREKRGWAYSIGSYVDFNSDNGFLAVLGGLKKDKAPEVIEIVKRELAEFPKNVTDEEIRRAKGFIKGINMIRFENTNKLALHLLINKIISGEIETPADEVSEIEKVTKKEIIEVAKEVFKRENMYLSLIGAFADEEKFAKILQQ